MSGADALESTTIGSFPPAREVRPARREGADDSVAPQQYDHFLGKEIRPTIEWQEHPGLDVLAHGKSERNDMVAYFAANLEGFAVTAYGWMQSDGSRCLRPPIALGDVSRSHPICVRSRERLRVDPDRALKSRTWAEGLPALEHLAAAARHRRAAQHASLS